MMAGLLGLCVVTCGHGYGTACRQPVCRGLLVASKAVGLRWRQQMSQTAQYVFHGSLALPVALYVSLALEQF